MTRRRERRLRPQQVNLLLGICLGGATLTGLTSWAIGTQWARAWTLLHALFGVMVVVLAPAKARGSVATGLRRGRFSRWVSVAFGVTVLVTIVLGFSHSTGAWAGVGAWTSLWTHVFLAFAALPMLVWHIGARPSRPRRVDFDRRLVMRGSVAAVTAGAIVGASESLVRAAGLRGGDRRFTGSHEIASGVPADMPRVSWINDSAFDIDISLDAWEVSIGAARVPIAELTALAEQSPSVEAVLDCTGGWWSRQTWTAVAVSELIDTSARSFEVVSATGYRVTFPMRDADHVYLATGYGGGFLRRGHGAPVRLVAPGRRGPWWVKWVTEVNPVDRRWWLQSPFPTT